MHFPPVTLPTDLPDRTPRTGSGERGPRRRVHRTCETCGAPFVVAPGWALLRKFCSNTCGRRSTGNARRINELNALPRPPARVQTCRTCEREFRPKRPDAAYCSRDCLWLDDDYRKRRAAGRHPTRIEALLYAALDEVGVVHERQASVGRYVADALLPEQRVVLEAAGVYWHRPRVTYDLARDAKLAELGFTVMHYSELDLGRMSDPKRYPERVQARWVEAIEAILRGEIAHRRPTLWPDELVVRSEPRTVLGAQ